jgi:hypothetical protein
LCAFERTARDQLEHAEECFNAAVAVNALTPLERSWLNPKLYGLDMTDIATSNGCSLSTAYRQQEELQQRLIELATTPLESIIRAFSNAVIALLKGGGDAITSNIADPVGKAPVLFAAFGIAPSGILYWRIASPTFPKHRFFIGVPRLRPYASLDSECVFDLIVNNSHFRVPDPPVFEKGQTDYPAEYIFNVYSKIVEFSLNDWPVFSSFPTPTDRTEKELVIEHVRAMIRNHTAHKA